MGSEGKLSKRLGSLGVDALRDAGIEPAALVALLARLGTSDPVDPKLTVEELVASFDLARFGRAPARFSEAELTQLNARILHRMPFEAVAARLPEGMNLAAWEAVRPNLFQFADVDDLWGIIDGANIYPTQPEEADYLAQAATIAASLDWSADPWHQLINALKETTGRKGMPLFLPLRLALTGLNHGPDMAALLPLIGREAAIARLQAAARG